MQYALNAALFFCKIRSYFLEREKEFNPVSGCRLLHQLEAVIREPEPQPHAGLPVTGT
jgi:hypothetical protein